MRDSLRILNRKEQAEIVGLVEEQWNASINLNEYGVLQSNQGKIYLASKDIFSLPLDKLRISSVGMYFGEVIKGNFIRLSIEGSQLVGPTAAKNVIILDDSEARQWLRGLDLDKHADTRGFVIIRHDNDFLGCGKSMGDKILNYVPKARRVTSSD